MYHGRIVKEIGEFENMEEVVEMLHFVPTLQDAVHYAQRHFSCGGDELALKAIWTVGKLEPHYT